MSEPRRRLLVAAATAVVAPGLLLANEAGRVYRLAVFFPGPLREMHRYEKVVLDRLARSGFVAGKNLSVEARGTSYNRPTDMEQVRALLSSKPDAFLTFGTYPTLMVRELAAAVPIVFTFVGDPVAYGVVRTRLVPAAMSPACRANREINRKRLELLRELVPGRPHVALVATFGGAGGDVVYRENLPLLRETAARVGFEFMEEIGWSAAGGFVPAVDAAVKRGADALFVLMSLAGTGYFFGGKDIVQATLERRVPAIFQEAEVVDMGGLASYGVNLDHEASRAADMLSKVLAGAKAGDLPIDKASRFELAVNSRTARAIGVEIPQSILLRADRVID